MLYQIVQHSGEALGVVPGENQPLTQHDRFGTVGCLVMRIHAEVEDQFVLAAAGENSWRRSWLANGYRGATMAVLWR